MIDEIMEDSPDKITEEMKKRKTSRSKKPDKSDMPQDTKTNTKFFDEKKTAEALKNMFMLENIALPLAVVSIIFTFLFNLSYLVSAVVWIVYTFYCFAFGFAISALCFSLLAACQKEKVVFLPSLVVSLVAIFAIVI